MHHLHFQFCLFFTVCVSACLYVCAWAVCLVPWSFRGCRSLRIGVSKLRVTMWVLGPRHSPLSKFQVLLTAESYLQPPLLFSVPYYLPLPPIGFYVAWAGLKLKKCFLGAGEIVQWLKVLGALVEDLSLICSTHMLSNNCQFQETGYSFLACADTVWIWCTNVHECSISMLNTFPQYSLFSG